jgi:hypothetical protein
MAHPQVQAPSEPLASLLVAIGECAQSPDRYCTCDELITTLHVLAQTPGDWQCALPVLKKAQASYQSRLRRRHLKTLDAINRAHATALQALQRP